MFSVLFGECLWLLAQNGPKTNPNCQFQHTKNVPLDAVGLMPVIDLQKPPERLQVFPEVSADTSRLGRCAFSGEADFFTLRFARQVGQRGLTQ